MINQELRLKRYEIRALREQRAVDLVKEALNKVGTVAVAALQNPAVSLPAGVAFTEWLYRKRWLTDVEVGAIAAVLISSGLLQSFKPIQLALGDR